MAQYPRALAELINSFFSLLVKSSRAREDIPLGKRDHVLSGCTYRCYERRYFLQIFRMGSVTLIGFGLGIDPCWPRHANSVLNVLGS
jgi:hypothetical protein